MVSNVLFAGDIRGTTDFYYWYVKSKTGGASNDDWKFIHRYSLGWRKKLTSTIDLSADIRATLSNTEDRDSSDLSPTFLLRMSNDIFSSNIGYRSTDVDPEEGDNTSSKIYSLDFISNLEDIPGLRGSYNKSENFTAGDITTQSSNLNLTSGYGYSFFDLKYDYTRNHSRDFKSEIARETDSHFGTIDMSESFLRNKINLSGRYGIIYSGIRDFSKEPTKFLEETGITRARFTTNLSTIFANMADVFYLLDNDKALSGSPTINIKNSNQNIGFDLGEVQRIDKIYLYVIPGSTTPVSVKANWVAVDWYLYSASTENSTWDLVTDGTDGISSVDFDQVNNRFVFEVSISEPGARYFKIVNNSGITTNDIYITEIEVLSYLSDTETVQLKSTILKHDVSFNANFQPIERIKMSYNLFYETYEREPISRTIFQLLQGANLSTTLHKYLSSLISYQTLLQHNATVKTGLDSYSLQFTSSPLKTLKTSLTLNRSESTEESRIESRGDSATFSIFSNLYYGVDLDVDFLISNYKDFSSGTKTTTKSINTDITLELTRKIRVTTYGTITWQSGVVTNSNTYIFRPTVNYRISESLYLTISEDLRGNGDFEVGSNFNANWRASQDLQFILGYNRWDGGDTTSENVNSTISWNISRYLVLRLQYTRSVQENDTKSKTDTFTTRLTTRF